MKQTGYTLIELLVVIAVIGVLASLSFIGITDSQARGRDTERAADIDILHDRLEEYYTDKGAYPDTLSTTIFPRMPVDALADPNGVSVVIHPPVASQAAAQSATSPTGTPNDYIYIPYPTNCGLTSCRGYILKSFIEVPTTPMPNPYIRAGLQNN